MTPARQRRLQRRVHLVAGAMLFAYVYAPIGDSLEDVVRLGIFPLLVATGLAMWQAPRMRRAWRARRR